MNIFKGLDFKLKNSSVSLGKFDGIHRGHRLLMEEIKKPEGLIPTVFTFEMNQTNLKIYTQEEKNTILEEIGIAREVIFPFNEQTKHMLPEDFIRQILVEKMDVKHICVGKDFHFGRNREGSIETLERYQKKYGYDLVIVPKLMDRNQVISSTRIREQMEQCDIKEVNRLLGKPYFMTGIVQHGNKLGRTIQTPTANLIPDANKKLLPYGVYATSVLVKEKTYFGVTNIGRKPTVGDYAAGVETYIMDFDQDIYGKKITVSFYDFLRAERKFDGIEELKSQMQQDKSKAYEILSNQKEIKEKNQ